MIRLDAQRHADFQIIQMPGWAPFRLGRSQVKTELSRVVAEKRQVIASAEMVVSLVPDNAVADHALGMAMADCVRLDQQIDDLLAVLWILDDGSVLANPRAHLTSAI